jgi:hypothetical protein
MTAPFGQGATGARGLAMGRRQKCARRGIGRLPTIHLESREALCGSVQPSAEHLRIATLFYL